MTASYEKTRLLSDYGISSDPFNTIHPLDQGARYFWQDKLVSTDVPMIVLTGITGVGKSLYAAEYTYENNRENSWLFASKGMLPSNLLKAIVQRFELKVSLAQLTLIQRRDAVIKALNASTKSYCLIIDDAHILPDETLLFITEFMKTANPNKLQMVLVGLPVLSDKVSMQLGEPQTELDITFKVIAPMNKTQVRQYISELLYASGLKKRLSIADGTIHKIYEASSGVARDVNKVSVSYLREILIQPKYEPVMPTSEKMFEQPENAQSKPIAGFFLMATAVVMMGVVYNVHYLYQSNNVFQAAKTQDDPLTTPESTTWVSESTQDPNVDGDTNIVLSQVATNTTTSITPTTEDENSTQTSQVTKETQQAVDKLNVIAKTLKDPSKIQARITADATTMMQSTGWALQVAATKQLTEVERWLSLFPEKNTKVVLAIRNKQPYYLLLIGPYSTMSEAKESVKQLSEKQRKFKPWVRSLKQLHQDIASYRELQSNPMIEVT